MLRETTSIMKKPGSNSHDTDKKNKEKKALLLWPAAKLAFLALMATMAPSLTVAEDFIVSPNGDPLSIGEALELAQPGDTVVLADGDYSDPIVTVRSGEEGNPITITGGSSAVVSGEFDDRVVTVRHSWISLEGFTVDGQTSDEDEASSFVDKCVFVWGAEDPEGTVQVAGGQQADYSIIGFDMEGMTVRNCGGECVRLKQFVVNSRISGNDVSSCGVHDYRYNGGGKNGEAIYIGTSSNQWVDGSPDETTGIEVSDNVLTPNGNECVEIKEGAYDNVVENNVCQEQRDDDAGCYGSRGDNNIFRFNTGDNCSGAGIRLGGWEVDGEIYGQHCDVYGNQFTNTGTGVVVARQLPQGFVCGNSCTDGNCRVIGDEDIQERWDQPCRDIAVGLTAEDDTITYDAGGSDDDDEREQEEQEEEGEDGDQEEQDSTDEDISSSSSSSSSSSGCKPIELLESYVTSSKSTQDSNRAANIVDGSLDTRWSAHGTSWLAIDLPASVFLSGVELAFEDGDERTQDFELVVLRDDEEHVSTSFHTSSGKTNDYQHYSFGEEEGHVLARTVLIVGFGNSTNDWNSFTELKLCEGDGGVPASRKLSGTRTASSLTSSSTWSSSVGRDGAGSSGTSSQIKDIRQSGKKKDGKKVGTRTTMNNIRGSGLRE